MDTDRNAVVEMDPEEFKKNGYILIDRITEFLRTIRSKDLTSGEKAYELKRLLGDEELPEKGKPVDEIIDHACDLLFEHSLLNGHPRFMGYITSSAAPIGALADLLAATVNPNVGAHILSPIATEIELQTVKWLSQLLGVFPDGAGILVSGGNMANMNAMYAGLLAKTDMVTKTSGIGGLERKPKIYCASSTHTWIDKAVSLFGLGSDSLSWIDINEERKMDLELLERKIAEDKANGLDPIMVIGTAGDVSSGSIDDLDGIAEICAKYSLWFHVDGAYGVPAVILPELKQDFKGLEKADSIAMDPHKWLYSPLEAGCTLLKEKKDFINAYSSQPVYYNFSKDVDDEAINFYEYGIQNSRGFRALKVWMSLQQVGRSGYEQMIREDINLASLMYEMADAHDELEAISNYLSISCFLYVPDNDRNKDEEYLNELNKRILNRLQSGGKAFVSNTIIDGKYVLRACIVNFRTSKKDIIITLDEVIGSGRIESEIMRRE